MRKYIATILISVALSYGLFAATLPHLTNGELTFARNEQTLPFEMNEEQLSIVEIARKAGPSVVGISAQARVPSFFNQDRMAMSHGSGIIIKENGYIVTNNHVIDGAETITVIMNTGEEYEAQVIGRDAKTDLAVVKIERNNLPYATLGSSDRLEVGEVAVAIGNPLGQEFAGTVTVGFVSALNRTLEVEGREFTLIQTDAAINPGNSGGALVNGYGQVIGINTVKVLAAEGLGFAIPIDSAKPIIENLIEHGYVPGRPVIGIIPGQDITPERSRRLGIPVGVYVWDILPNSGAEAAGIRPRDVIVRMDGEESTTLRQLDRIKDRFQAGDTLSIEVKRRNASGQWEEVSFNVVLTEERPTTE